MNTARDVLRSCTLHANTLPSVGGVIKLPANTVLDRKLYLSVKVALETMGGSWKGGKVQGFTFDNFTPAVEALHEYLNGNDLPESEKKKFQYFPTPDDLADELVNLAEIEARHSILEPSAGQGAIIKAIQRRLPPKHVYYFELWNVNRKFLSAIPFTHLVGEDFLDYEDKVMQFDRIIANPPFSKNQDIAHIREMWNWLKVGGRLVTMASTHWKLSQNKKEREFRQWLSRISANVHMVERGVFHESGTETPTTIIVADKLNETA